MQFLRSVFWIVLGIIGFIFSFNNWQIVTVKLWGDLVLDTPLPLLLLVVFLLGLLPILMLHRATRWNLTRKLDAAQRTLSDAQVVTPPFTPPPPAPAIAITPTPPAMMP
jgi:lipopolysaccharide assembly protein A